MGNCEKYGFSVLLWHFLILVFYPISRHALISFTVKRCSHIHHPQTFILYDFFHLNILKYNIVIICTCIIEKDTFIA